MTLFLVLYFLACLTVFYAVVAGLAGEGHGTRVVVVTALVMAVLAPVAAVFYTLYLVATWVQSLFGSDR